MYRNYFYLYRCSEELNARLKERTVFEAYTQERDKLFLRVPLKEFQDHHIIFDCSPLLNCIVSKERHFKAKKNTIGFFSDYLPEKIMAVKIALNDRFIVFELSESLLCFVIQGGNTNVFIQKGSLKSFFKKSGEDSVFLPEHFVENKEDIFLFLKSVNDNSLDWRTFSRQFPFAGKDIFLNSKASVKSDTAEEFGNCLRGAIEKVLYEKIAVCYDIDEAKPRFLPESFAERIVNKEQYKLFDSYSDALNYYLGLKYRNSNEISLKNRIEKYLLSETEKIAAKLNKLKFRLDEGTKENEYREIGNLLLANIYKIARGAANIEVENPVTGEIITVKLDNKLSPQKNIDRYFEKSRDEKTSYEQSKELHKTALERMNRLNEINERINSEISQEELEKIFNKLKINQQSKTNKMEDKFNFRHYILHGKYHVYVGKDSRNNDELTTQFAKQNDLWFHARGSAGSHCILRVENPKEAVPKNIIKEAASIAAFYSKAKTAGMAPVSYTFKKYVHKKKGLEQGQVIMQREDVVLVKPEIPKDCEPVVSDLI